MLVLPQRCEVGEAQSGWLRAFPAMRRVVHRHDAGRGKFRRPSDWLLSKIRRTTRALDVRTHLARQRRSAGDDFLGRARLRMTPADAGTEWTRRLDAGPWTLSETAPRLVAMHAPGATLGSCVIRYDAHGGVLFSGRVLGYDERSDEVSGFALELDHDAGVHSATLAALADLPSEWDFEWLVPSRGRPVHFKDAQAAREAIQFAKARCDLLMTYDPSTASRTSADDDEDETAAAGTAKAASAE